MVYVRIPTVKEACELDPRALDFALSEQVEHLSDLLNEAEGAADEFFARNHVTQGMERLLREGLQRLAGKSGQAVFELRQAMGGGKTHLLVGFGLLAKYPTLRKQYSLFRTFGDMACAGILREGPRVTQWNRRLSGTVISNISDIIAQPLCDRPPYRLVRYSLRVAY